MSEAVQRYAKVPARMSRDGWERSEGIEQLHSPFYRD
jgi:hypothetical protein